MEQKAIKHNDLEFIKLLRTIEKQDEKAVNVIYELLKCM